MRRRPRAHSRTYRYERGHAALVTEIYLPQKYALSPALLQALTDSLKPAEVRRHFNTVEPHRIIPLLPEHLRLEYRRIKNRLIRSGRSFGGYSVATLSGAFGDSHGSRGSHVEYDANTIVRIVDWPTIRDLSAGRRRPRLTHDFVQRVVRTVFGLRRVAENRPSFETIATADLKGPMSDADKETVRSVYTALERWLDEESLLLYGFVIYHLARVTGYEETEILTTSHFTIVNRYRRGRLQ
jgi:hypothetical protein